MSNKDFLACCAVQNMLSSLLTGLRKNLTNSQDMNLSSNRHHVQFNIGTKSNHCLSTFFGDHSVSYGIFSTLYSYENTLKFLKCLANLAHRAKWCHIMNQLNIMPPTGRKFGGLCNKMFMANIQS